MPRRASQWRLRREAPRVAAKQPAQRIPHLRRNTTRLELPELELLVVAAHLLARLLPQAERLDKSGSKVVELQPARLPGAQQRRVVERADERERIGRGLATWCSFEEPVDQDGELVGLRAGTDEELVDRKRLVAGPATHELVEQLFQLTGHDSSHSLRRALIRERAW